MSRLPQVIWKSGFLNLSATPSGKRPEPVSYMYNVVQESSNMQVDCWTIAQPIDGDKVRFSYRQSLSFPLLEHSGGG